jgi:hypothetical protein
MIVLLALIFHALLRTGLLLAQRTIHGILDIELDGQRNTKFVLVELTSLVSSNR